MNFAEVSVRSKCEIAGVFEIRHELHTCLGGWYGVRIVLVIQRVLPHPVKLTVRKGILTGVPLGLDEDSSRVDGDSIVWERVFVTRRRVGNTQGLLDIREVLDTCRVASIAIKSRK